jgi:hypothetical protein
VGWRVYRPGMTRLLLLALLLPALAACDRLRSFAPRGWADSPAPAIAPQPRPEAAAAPAPTAAVAPQRAAPAAVLDTTTPAEKAAALAAPATGAELGRVVVIFGNPAEPGFWLRSGLVAAPRPGTVRLASGATAQVDLLPAAGGAAQLSLAAYRALGLGLTDLPQVTVLGR